jgi:hypothetical protein
VAAEPVHRHWPASRSAASVRTVSTKKPSSGLDPLHLAHVFGISSAAATRYTQQAKQLTAPPLSSITRR